MESGSGTIWKLIFGLLVPVVPIVQVHIVIRAGQVNFDLFVSGWRTRSRETACANQFFRDDLKPFKPLRSTPLTSLFCQQRLSSSLLLLE